MEMNELEIPLPTYDQVVSVQLEPPPYSNEPPLNTNYNGWQTQNLTGYPITSQPYYVGISDEITDHQESLHLIDGEQSQDCCTGHCCTGHCCTGHCCTGHCCGDDCCGDDCCTGDYCGDYCGDDCCTGDYCGDCGDDCCIDAKAVEAGCQMCLLCCQIILMILEAASKWVIKLQLNTIFDYTMKYY